MTYGHADALTPRCDIDGCGRPAYTITDTGRHLCARHHLNQMKEEHP